MSEPIVKTLQSNLGDSLQEIRQRATEEIQKNGFSSAAAILLAISELIKEQTQDENISHSTR